MLWRRRWGGPVAPIGSDAPPPWGRTATSHLLFIGHRSARTLASQGEQRTLALSLRLAAFWAVADVIGEQPLLLLDDVFSELDMGRAGALGAALPAAQVFVTTARDDEVPVKGRRWDVAPGEGVMNEPVRFDAALAEALPGWGSPPSRCWWTSRSTGTRSPGAPWVGISRPVVLRDGELVVEATSGPAAGLLRYAVGDLHRRLDSRLGPGHRRPDRCAATRSSAMSGHGCAELAKCHLEAGNG